MGLVAYRDIGDDYVTKTFDLTTDIQGLYADLLQLRARGGGDWPESVNEALYVGVTKMNWSRGRDSTRIIFLVGDAPPHMDYAQDMKYPEVMRLARARDITVNTVQAGSARDTERYWREIAQMGRGEYMMIPQDGGKIVVIETPYDREIIELQGRINRTVVPYGSQTQQRGVRDRVQQYALGGPRRSPPTWRAIWRSAPRVPDESPKPITGDGDLVGDVASGRQSLSALPEAQLPDDLRRMSPAERQAHIDRQMNERRTLNERLSDARAAARPPHRRRARARRRGPRPTRSTGGRADAALADRALDGAREARQQQAGAARRRPSLRIHACGGRFQGLLAAPDTEPSSCAGR